MDTIKTIATGGVITLFVGGTLFTFSQQDVIENFASDTGLTQEQAEQYINEIPEEEMVSFSALGFDFLKESEATLEIANAIDCANYEYEWETPILTCRTAISQLQQLANTEQSLGRAYIKMSSDTGSENDMRTAIRYLDQLNSNYDLEIVRVIFDNQHINEFKMTNSYNKALLTAALKSN